MQNSKKYLLLVLVVVAYFVATYTTCAMFGLKIKWWLPPFPITGYPIPVPIPIPQ